MRKPYKTVGIFGSSRVGQATWLFSQGFQCGQMLARQGWTVCTGGGEGLMKSVSLGALEAGTAILTQLEPEDDYPVLGQFAYSDFMNPELNNEPKDEEEKEARQYLHRVESIYDCDAYIALPGGYGTTLEVLQLCEAMQKNKIPHKPLFVVGETHRHALSRLMHDCRKHDFISANEIYHRYYEFPTDAASALCALSTFAHLKPR